MARMDWQRAQADLQMALAQLEKCVAGNGTPADLLEAREAVARKQKLTDDLLGRYITQLGKPGEGRG